MKKILLLVVVFAASINATIYHWKYAGVTDSLLCTTNWVPNWTVKDPTVDSLEIGDSSASTFKLYPGKSLHVKYFRRGVGHTGTFNLLGDYQSTMVDACTTEVFIDSGITGSSNYPPNLVFDGAASSWINSASNGTEYAASTTIKLTNNTKLRVKTFKKIQAVKIYMDTACKYQLDSGATSADGIYLSGTGSPMIYAAHDDTIANNCISGINLSPTGNQKYISSPDRTLVINGNGAQGTHFTTLADNKLDTIGFFRSQQTVNTGWSSNTNAYSVTVIVNDSIFTPNDGSINVTNASAPGKTVKWKWLTGTVLTGGLFGYGSSDATGTFINVFNGSEFNVDYFVTSATGPVVDSFQNFTMRDSSIFKYAASNHSVYVTNFSLYLVGGTGTRIQPYGKPVGWICFRKSANVWDSLSSNDSLVVMDTMRIESGKFQNGTSPASPLIISKGLVISSADTCRLKAAVRDSGDAYFGTGLKLEWTAGVPLQMIGATGTQKLTTSGNIIPLIVHKNGSILQPQDSLNCNNLLDSSSGTYDMDYGTRCSTAVFKGTDSIAMSGNMEIINNLSFGLQTRENITGTIKWIGAGAAILADSGTQLGDVTVAKTAGVAWSSVGITRFADFTGTSGNITLGASATDTVYMVDAVFNNAAVTVNAPVIVSGTFSCAGATVFTYGTGGKIIMPSCVPGTTNGNATVVLTYPAGCGGGSATSSRWYSKQNINGILISP